MRDFGERPDQQERQCCQRNRARHNVWRDRLDIWDEEDCFRAIKGELHGRCIERGKLQLTNSIFPGDNGQTQEGGAEVLGSLAGI